VPVTIRQRQRFLRSICGECGGISGFGDPAFGWVFPSDGINVGEDGIIGVAIAGWPGLHGDRVVVAFETAKASGTIEAAEEAIKKVRIMGGAKPAIPRTR